MADDFDFTGASNAQVAREARARGYTVRRARDGDVVKPTDVQEGVWQDFLDLREEKKAKVTNTALNLIRTEAEKVGWTMNDALKECCARGWRGFKGAWVQCKATGGGYGASGKL